MQFAPPYDPLRLAIAALLTVLFGLWLYRVQWERLTAAKSAILTTLRLSVLGALFFILFNPVESENLGEQSRRPFAVLIDTSRSMNTTDCDGRPRIEAVKESLQGGRILERLGENRRLMLYRFADRLQPWQPSALAEYNKCDGGSTALADSLASILKSGYGGGEPFSGVLVLSDGQDNTGGDTQQVARLALAQGVPIWTSCAGGNTMASDVALVSYIREDYVFVKHKAHITVEVYQTGFDQSTVMLRLKREDEEILTRPVTFAGTNHQRISLPVEEEQRGLYRYSVSVDALPGEADLKNNTRTVFLKAIDEKIRVLLLESMPHWETKFLASALREDENISLTSLFQLTDRKSYGLVEDLETDVDREVERIAIPETAAEFGVYDVVVLGRDCNNILTAQGMAALRDYAAGGGNVLFARGPGSRKEDGSTAFGALEPVLWGDGRIGAFRLQISPEGRMSSVFDVGRNQAADEALERLPGMLGAAIIRGVRPGARVLASAPVPLLPGDSPMAVITHQHFGKGNTLLVDAEGMWRWAFLSEELAEFDDLYNRFWGQLVRWLVADASEIPGQNISFRSDRLSYDSGDRVTFHIFSKQADPSAFHPGVTINPPGGEPVRLQPRLEGQDSGVYTATAEAGAEGEYEAVLTTGLPAPNDRLELRYTVYSDSYEDIMVAADANRLRNLAETSGASFLELNNLEALFPQIHEKMAAQVNRTEVTPWWDTKWMLALVIGLFGVEWFIRRRSGLY